MSNKKMDELYTINFLGNVIGGKIIEYANNLETWEETPFKWMIYYETRCDNPTSQPT